MSSWGYLKNDTPFNHLFPDGKVPLVSIFQAIPREEGAPPCYWVDGSRLSEHQIEELSKMLYQMWQPECQSLESAIAYVRGQLPLNAEWFNGVATDSMFFLDDELDEIPI